MIYTRGSFEDFDRYANLSGDQGWAWKNILPYFKKGESWTAPADNHNVTGQFDPTNHGFKGEVAVSLPGRGTSTDGRIMDAIAELGGEFEFNLDMNSGRELGVGGSSACHSGGSLWLGIHRMGAKHDQGRRAEQFCHSLPCPKVHQTQEPSCCCKCPSVACHSDK